LRFFGVLEVADVLADDLDLGRILQEPADGCDLDGLGVGQGCEIAPLPARLPAVLPANDDQGAVSVHAGPAL
jgi:hypothetical protein